MSERLCAYIFCNGQGGYYYCACIYSCAQRKSKRNERMLQKNIMNEYAAYCSNENVLIFEQTRYFFYYYYYIIEL